MVIHFCPWHHMSAHLIAGHVCIYKYDERNKKAVYKYSLPRPIYIQLLNHFKMKSEKLPKINQCHQGHYKTVNSKTCQSRSVQKFQEPQNRRISYYKSCYKANGQNPKITQL